MINFLIRRLLLLIPVIMGVLIIVSTLLRYLPGDVVDQLAGPMATEEEREELREGLGLNLSFFEQMKRDFARISRGDLGKSLLTGESVKKSILTRLWPTIELAFLSILFAVFLSLVLGIVSAVKENSLADIFSLIFSLVGVSMPNFWLGPLLILFFSVQLDLLPVSERDGFLSYILPVVTLGTALCAVLTRTLRSSLLDNLKEDYVRTAKSKGLDLKTILLRHVLKNSMLPLITLIGLQFGALLTGSIITEKIFDWPGIGTLTLEAISNRDFPMVQGIVLFYSLSYVFVSFLTDLLYAFVDPRIKIK